MRKMLLVGGLVLLFILQMGCVRGDGQAQSGYAESQEQPGVHSLSSPVMPQTKPDGGKYTLAYVDIDPYPTTGAILYHIIMGLREEGWISFDSLPFDPDDTDAGALIAWLAKQDLGPYIRFDTNANYYTAYVPQEDIRQSLAEHVENERVDIVLSMGTSPSKMCKAFGLPVPLMMFGCVDPVGSGLIASVEDSGDPLIWATFDPTAYERQLLYYYDCIAFSNIGIVYYDENIASLPSYEKASDELGIQITRSEILRIDSGEYRSDDEYYEMLKAEFARMVRQEGIDAFMLTTDIIVDVDRAERLLEVFTNNRIPVFVQVGESLVEHGALLNVSAVEYEGMGIFGARSITQAICGIPLPDLPQEYKNSPYLNLNLNTAERIGFEPTFETLLACEHVYTKRSE